MQNSSLPNYLTVNEMLEKYSWLKPGGLRHFLFNSKKNGLEKAIRRMGKRKILINEQLFFLWIDEQNEGEKR